MNYSYNEMLRAFECGRNFQLTGENNFQELINDLSRELQVELSLLGETWSREKAEHNKNIIIQELQTEPFNTHGETLNEVVDELNRLIDEEEVRQTTNYEN